jgi:hypothetical protein
MSDIFLTIQKQKNVVNELKNKHEIDKMMNEDINRAKRGPGRPRKKIEGSIPVLKRKNN